MSEIEGHRSSRSRGRPSSHNRPASRDLAAQGVAAQSPPVARNAGSLWLLQLNTDTFRVAVFRCALVSCREHGMLNMRANATPGAHD